MINKVVIILGSTNDKNGNISEIGVQRLGKGFQIYKESAGIKILLTGGFGAHFNTTNTPYSQYAKTFLLSLGVLEEDILELVLSKDTVEDAKMSLPIINKYKPESIVVVTSQFHLERVKYIFGKIYLDIKLEYASVEYESTPEEMDKLISVEVKEMKLLKRTGKSSIGSSII